MNNITTTILIATLVACTPKNSPTDMPQDLTELRKLKSQKRKEILQIQTQIEKIDSLIYLADPTSKIIDPIPVTVDTVHLADLDQFIDIQASVQAGEEILVSSETGGRIIRLYPKEGGYIRKGALVAKTDMESLQKQLTELETAYQLADQIYNKQARLWAKQIGSEVQYLQAKNEKDRLDKKRATLKHQLSKANIYAPISGVVDQVFVESGEVASPGMPIIKILNTNRLKIKADVPERYIKSIRRGDQVQVDIPVLDFSKNLKITRVASSINPANRTFSVEANISNKNNILKPNLLALMKIKEATIEHAIVIPIHLVQNDLSGTPYVFVVDQQAKTPIAIKKTVSLGTHYNDQVIITSGLNPGDVIIAQGAQQLTKDSHLQIIKK